MENFEDFKLTNDLLDKVVGGEALKAIHFSGENAVILAAQYDCYCTCYCGWSGSGTGTGYIRAAQSLSQE